MEVGQAKITFECTHNHSRPANYSCETVTLTQNDEQWRHQGTNPKLTNYLKFWPSWHLHNGPHTFIPRPSDTIIHQNQDDVHEQIYDTQTAQRNNIELTYWMTVHPLLPKLTIHFVLPLTADSRQLISYSQSQAMTSIHDSMRTQRQ